MFDYIFYRLLIFYQKKNPKSFPISTSTLYLSGMQFFMAFCVFMTINVFLRGELSKGLVDMNRNWLKFEIVVLFFVLELFNYLKYKKKEKIDFLKGKYKNHHLNNVIKPWMFIVFGIGLFFFPILVSSILKTIF